MVTGDQPICLDCSTGLPLTNFWLHAGNPVEKIFWGRLRIEAAASMLYFTKRSIIQNLLHELKYRGNKEVGRLLGRMMGEKLEQSERFKDVDALVPLPLLGERLASSIAVSTCCPRALASPRSVALAPLATTSLT